jgi:hypothetical protein
LISGQTPFGWFARPVGCFCEAFFICTLNEKPWI